MNITSSPTYHTSVEQKIRARRCALMLKNGSPKLRDLLRNNCRIRMKESRANAFLSSRHQLLKTIVQEELANEIEIHENILKEIMESWEQWQQEEYEKEFMYIDEDDDRVFCPICEIKLLQLNENIISCECGLRLYYPKSLNDFYNTIITNIKTHELHCSQKLMIFTVPKDGFNVLALNTACLACNYSNPIVELI